MSASVQQLRRALTQLRAFGRRERRPGDLALQTGVLLLGIPALTWLLVAGFLMLHDLTPASAGVLLIAGCVAAAGLAYLYGHTTWIASLGIAVGVLLVSLVLCSQLVDLSYDGQDYHYTAIWALANGWNPYRFGEFADFAAPASDLEPWAPHYPKGDWLTSAAEVVAGFGIETAKNSGVLLLAAAFCCAFALFRALALGTLASALLAACAAANPVSLAQLFMRMCDGRLASLTVIFVSLLILALKDREWRFLPPAALALLLAVNMKFSMIPAFLCFGGAACLAAWWRHGVRAAAVAGAALIAFTVVSVFVIGWDPYLRNAVHNGHPFYPAMGKGHLDMMSDWRPPALNAHSSVARLGMSLASATGYDGPIYKIPFAVSADELTNAGDPEPRFGGFGPWFFPGLLAACGALLAVTVRGRRGSVVPMLLLNAAAGVLLSTLAMPESWLARYAPYFWLFPVLIAAAAILSGGRIARALGWAAAAILLTDSALVGGSSFAREALGSRAVQLQIAHFKQNPENLCANFGGAPARWELLREAGLDVAIRETPAPAGCGDLQPMPYVAFEEADKLGDICHCPTRGK